MKEMILDVFIQEDEMFVSSDGNEFEFGHFRLEEVSYSNWLRLYRGGCRLVPVGEE